MKMIRTLLIGLVWVVALSSFAQEIDPSQSIVNFNIGNMGLSSVKGTFTGMKGEVEFSSSDMKPASFEVCIDASSVNTRNEKRDEHLKTEDFFHVEKFPEICFESDKVLETENGFEAHGSLKMHGVTNQVIIPFTYVGNTLKGSLTIERLDYQLGPDGGFMVGKSVDIEISCVLK